MRRFDALDPQYRDALGVWRSNPISHSLRLVRVSMRERGESRVSSSHRVSEAHRSKLLDHPRLHALSWPRCGRDLWRTTGGGESRTPKSYRSPTVGRDGAPTPSLGSNLYEHTPCRRRVGSPSSSERATRPESGSLLVVSFAAYKLENFNIIYLSFGSRPPTPVYARRHARVAPSRKLGHVVVSARRGRHFCALCGENAALCASRFASGARRVRPAPLHQHCHRDGQAASGATVDGGSSNCC